MSRLVSELFRAGLAAAVFGVTYKIDEKLNKNAGFDLAISKTTARNHALACAALCWGTTFLKENEYNGMRARTELKRLQAKEVK